MTNEYFHAAKLYFEFLTKEFGFSVSKEKSVGNAYYDLEFTDGKRAVSVSYENISDYFQVIIVLLENGEMPSYDDKTKTLHLNRLNSEIIPKIDKAEIASNNEYFQKFEAENELEAMLLKSAKELRLCLRHFDAAFEN